MVPDPVTSVAQMRLPEASVLMVLAVLQPVKVPTCSPPVWTTRPVKVEVAEVKSLVALTPVKVEVAVEDVALKYGASMPWVAESPPVKRSPPPKVEVAVLVPMIVPRVTKLPVTVRSLLTDEEAMETKPPRRVERPAMSAVEDAPNAPPTWNIPVTVDEAVERKPPPSVERPDAAKVEEAVKAPVTFNVLLTDDEAVETKPP